MLLDVPKMVRPFLDNYDTHVDRFVGFLRKLDCQLVYEGPSQVQDHVRDRTVYACSVKCLGNKVLPNVFPVMLGSKLDLAIRKKATYDFSRGVPDPGPLPFEVADIGLGFFIVNGCLRQVPYFFTNDPTNTHLVKKTIVRCYDYDANDRGRQLSYYTDGVDGRRRGELCVVLNDGSSSTLGVDFFGHCPYPVRQEAYMSQVFKEDRFDIDHLSNKIVVSPGHLFVKLFVKYLYGPLQAKKWQLVKSKGSLVAKSIETGCLLHVLSRKTLYFKENSGPGKMVSAQPGSHREIGVNGEVYMEKSTGCYREVNSQSYPLNPYLLPLVVRQLSSKVKSSAVCAFHPSYVGFLCLLGCFDTKNVGRTHMMVRDSYVSDHVDLDPVFDAHPKRSRLYELLDLEVASPGMENVRYVVVNEACVPVTTRCFERIDLLLLKRALGRIECLQRGPFAYVRYKIGFLYKRLLGTDVWVTARDEMYWAERLLGIRTRRALVDAAGYDYVCSHLVDLNPFFHHNAFPRNMLAFNALKNAILATDRKYARYFLDTVSAYTTRTALHEPILPPADDGVSEHFVMYVPKITVAYHSFLGRNQEDCIVVRDGLDCFDCCRFYTVRLKVSSGPYQFHPVRGDPDDDQFLGTVVGRGRLSIEPQSIYVRLVPESPSQYKIFFTKSPFRVLQFQDTPDRLVVCVEQAHPSSTGDKLCSLHGQKGVVRFVPEMPLLDESVTPDAVVNPYALFRMTPGQILEGLHCGGGRDSETFRNSDGDLVPVGSTFYAKTFYFPIAYLSSEHIYAPSVCVRDKINGQAVKGRSRGGGMRLGNMELLNGMRGNGIASCFEQKFFEHGDRPEAVPKSAYLVKEDARFFKCHLDFAVQPPVAKL